jgi:predicted RND superfamily exporter protein
MALLFTSLVLAGGFFVLMFASMVNTQRFGFLAASAALVAFVADVVVAPALMTLVARWKEARP